MKYVCINKDVVNKIMSMSDRRINYIESVHELANKETNNKHLAKSRINKGEMISFIIENGCGEVGNYRIVIKCSAKNVNMYRIE